MDRRHVCVSKALRRPTPPLLGGTHVPMIFGATYFGFTIPYGEIQEKRIHHNVIKRVSRTNRKARFVRAVIRRKRTKTSRIRSKNPLFFTDEKTKTDQISLHSSFLRHKQKRFTNVDFVFFYSFIENVFIFSHRHVFGVSPTTPLKIDSKTYATKRNTYVYF